MTSVQRGITAVFSLIILCTQCSAYSNYQDSLPNGYNVNHPCIPNYRWPGVGHQNRNGGGKKNIFGQHFQEAGHQWTKSLCQTDSDGDGRTNGEELGDPQCIWSTGQVPSRTTDITHPGVCEPLNDARCEGKNNFVSCQLDTMDNCPVINSSDVQTIDLRFPTISVPPNETNLMCMTFDLPSDKDYHIVANRPIINNSIVLHHMLLFGCSDANATAVTTPKLCGMGGSDCSSIIGGWSVGSTGECYHEKYGFRIGTTGYIRVQLQIHYNNPMKIAHYLDSSGLRLYYRPARPEVKDLYSLLTGQFVLDLPPGQMRVEQVGRCHGSCTSEMFNQPVFVISAFNHMHYLGRSMKIEVLRNGHLVSNLSNDESYNYDSPVTHYHNTPVQILPGDEIRTTCVYNTISSKRWVHYGDATSDEMCFGFLAVYPKSAINRPDRSCSAISTLSSCEYFSKKPVNGCDWVSLPSSEDLLRMSIELYKNCQLEDNCRPECSEAIKTINSHPCFYGEVAKFVKGRMMKSREGLEFMRRLYSCPLSIESGQASLASIQPLFSGLTSWMIISYTIAALLL